MEIPTIREEIDRKALETIEKLQFDLSSGRINSQQYSYGISILWSAVSGLANDDFRQIIELMGEQVKKTPNITRSHFYSEKGVAARIINAHDGRVVLTMFRQSSSNDMKKYDFREEPNASALGLEQYEKLRTKLKDSGFIEIS
jgi:hypothetical protein